MSIYKCQSRGWCSITLYYRHQAIVAVSFMTGTGSSYWRYCATRAACLAFVGLIGYWDGDFTRTMIFTSVGTDCRGRDGESLHLLSKRIAWLVSRSFDPTPLICLPVCFPYYRPHWLSNYWRAGKEGGKGSSSLFFFQLHFGQFVFIGRLHDSWVNRRSLQKLANLTQYSII